MGAHRSVHLLDGLAGMQAAGRRQHDAVDAQLGLGRQQLGQRGKASSAGLGDGGLQGSRVGIADGHQFGALGVLLDRLDVVLGDTAAADQREADPAAGDGRTVLLHGFTFE